MSARLKADAALCWARTTLMRVPYFQGENLEDNFLASTALCLQTRVFCRSEYLQVDDLQIVERGICAKQGRIFAKGSCLGEDMVLADAIFRDLTPAVALTFVAQVAAMEKKHLEQLLNEYPIARRKIRAATYRLAFCRAMVALARIFSRDITSWNHPDILAANPKLTYSGPIKVVHRVLGSSSTAGFTEYLQQKCPASWTLGTGSTITWPEGTFEGQGSGGRDGLTGG